MSGFNTGSGYHLKLFKEQRHALPTSLHAPGVRNLPLAYTGITTSSTFQASGSLSFQILIFYFQFPGFNLYQFQAMYIR